ncbi:MAG: Ribonuclease HII, partial [uncultured Nocardioidaceae bacterium]
DPSAAGHHDPPRRRALRLRAGVEPKWAGARRRCRRSRPRRLRGAARRRGGDSSRGARRFGSGAGGLQAPDGQGARALLRAHRPSRRVVVGRRGQRRGVRRPRHARGQRRGVAPGAGAARRQAALRADRRLPRGRSRGAGLGGLEGRPGGRLHRCCVGDSQGDPRPSDDADARALPGVRLRRPQGICDQGASTGAERPRPVPAAPKTLHQRATRRWLGTRRRCRDGGGRRRPGRADRRTTM